MVDVCGVKTAGVLYKLPGDGDGVIIQSSVVELQIHMKPHGACFVSSSPYDPMAASVLYVFSTLLVHTL